MKTSQKIMVTAALCVVAYMAFFMSWIKGKQLVLTLVLMGLSVAAVVAAQHLGGAAAPEALPEPEADEAGPEDEAASGDWTGLGLALLGLGAAWGAYRAVLAERWGLSGLLLFAGALAWRKGLPLRLPRLSRRALGAALLLALLAASAFRLSKAGEVPVGMAMVDEPRLLLFDHGLLAGERPTMYVVGDVFGDGLVPYYLETLGLKLFGISLTGFRMSAILIGIFITGIIFLLGMELGGAWTGLASAFFWAVCLWPVSISRAHYLMVESHLVVLLCMLFSLMAFRTRRSLYFGLAGFFWGLCFQVYHAAQFMAVLLPLLFLLAWIFKPALRASLLQGLIPLLACFFIGLGPLFLWAWKNPAQAYQSYFGVLSSTITVGDTVNANQGVIEKLDSLLGHVIPLFPRGVQLFTKHGPLHAYYFPSLLESKESYPIFHPAVFMLFLAGFSVCLARFRKPAYAFLIYWWVLGLMPNLMTAPGLQPDDRRSMMTMLPMLLMAAVGLVTPLGLAARAFSGRARAAAALGLGLAFFAFLAPASWSDYFFRNQRDLGLLDWDMANLVSQARAISAENAKGPIALVTTQRLNVDSWNGPNSNSFNTVYESLLRCPTRYVQENPDYYHQDGLFGALRWAATQGAPGGKPCDVLVALTPFHFYLEPLLQRLGGRTVAEIPVVQARQGILLSHVGMAPPVAGLSMKLVRLHGLKPAVLDALKAASFFNFTEEELQPPDQDRVLVSKEGMFRPDMLALLADYEARPGRWKILKKAAFSVPDPWFWTTMGSLPGNISMPFRLRSQAELNIATAGSYAFGASATPFTTLRLDGKKVFTFVPKGGEQNELAKHGIVGEAVALKPGKHRLEIEQVWLSCNGNFNHVLRLVWQKPGQAEMETLPLEILKPLGSPAR